MSLTITSCPPPSLTHTASLVFFATVAAAAATVSLATHQSWSQTYFHFCSNTAWMHTSRCVYKLGDFLLAHSCCLSQLVFWVLLLTSLLPPFLMPAPFHLTHPRRTPTAPATRQGHDHNLQHLVEDPSLPLDEQRPHFWVSGAGCKTDPLAREKRAVFAEAAHVSVAVFGQGLFSRP
jgi:hypothetical protein